jgi:hypothetical protein
MDDTKQRPYPDDPGQTHYDGCWRSRGHHNCAVARVEQLEGEAERMTGLENVLDISLHYALIEIGHTADKLGDLDDTELVRLASGELVRLWRGWWGEAEQLRQQWSSLCNEVEDLTGALHDGDVSLEEVVAAVRLLRDRCDYAGEDSDICRAEIERLRAALRGLYDACCQADAIGELYGGINGDLLDAAANALKGGECKACGREWQVVLESTERNEHQEDSDGDGRH